jgi:hypothetical protein
VSTSKQWGGEPDGHVASKSCSAPFPGHEQVLLRPSSGRPRPQLVCPAARKRCQENTRSLPSFDAENVKVAVSAVKTGAIGAEFDAMSCAKTCFAGKVREIEGGFGGVAGKLEFWALQVTAARMRGALRSLCGGRVRHLRGWGGVTRHAVGTLRGCATSVGMLLRPGGHDVLAPRRGVWVPHGDSAGGVFHEEPIVAPMSPSMRSARL